MITRPPDRLISKLDELDAQYEALGLELVDPEVLSDHRAVRTRSIKRAAIAPLVEDYRAYRNHVDEVAELQEVAAGDDPELAELARAEIDEHETAAAG